MDHLALLEGEVVAMAAALSQADPDQPVAACPGWTVRDLVAHVIGVHRWATAALATTTPPSYDEAPVEGDLAVAYTAAGHQLVAALRATPADTPCWTFDRSDRTAGFWRRRQLHELTVHRYDVAPFTVSDEVAQDGVDEVFDFFLPRQVGMGRAQVPAGTLRLETGATPAQAWYFGDGRPVTTVTGSRSDLLLWLWGRLPLQGSGDVTEWQAAALTP